MTSEHTEQPAPTPNGRAAVQAMVRRDLEERQAIGTARYGTPLQAFNGRDALRDAYEEALDLACYLRQAIAERDELATRPYRVVDRSGDVWEEQGDGRFVCVILRGKETDSPGRPQLSPEALEKVWGPLSPVKP